MATTTTDYPRNIWPENEDFRVLWKAVTFDPFDDVAKFVLSDWIEEQGGKEVGLHHAETLRAGNIPFSVIDKNVLFSLKNARKTGWHRSFVGSIDRVIEKQHVRFLTPRQFSWMWILAHRYRRQVFYSKIQELAAERYARYLALMNVDAERWKRKIKPMIAHDWTPLFDYCPTETTGER